MKEKSGEQRIMGKKYTPILETSNTPTDWEALRCIMAAIIYGEIRHEKFLQHDLSNLEPKDLYRSVFQAVDGLIEESKNG